MLLNYWRDGEESNLPQPDGKSITLILRPFQAKYKQGYFWCSTIKLPPHDKSKIKRQKSKIITHSPFPFSKIGVAEQDLNLRLSFLHTTDNLNFSSLAGKVQIKGV